MEKQAKISGIYKIINKVNGKYYVGSSKDIKGNSSKHGRWKAHIRELNNKIHINNHLQCAWDLYGKESFDFIIVELVSENYLLEVEQKYLDIAKTEKDKVYNMSFIAGRVDYTSEVRKKMSDARIGKYVGNKSPDYIEVDMKTSEMLKGVWIEKGKNGMIEYAKQHYGFGYAPCRRLIKKFRKDKNLVKLRKKCYIRNFRENIIPNRVRKLGLEHHYADKNIYTFHNFKTKEIFIGNKYEFINKFPEHKSHMFDLIHKNIKATRDGWTLEPDKIIKYVNPKKDVTQYKFYNKFTNEFYLGTRSDIKIKYNLVRSLVDAIVNGSRKHHKGWVVIHNP